MWQNERWISKGKWQGMAKAAEPQHSGRGIPMPYAVVRSQFAENLQVTAPYGRGWSLLAWWPFFPFQNLLIGPNALPLLLPAEAAAFFTA